jgi:hypothetical protein
MEWSDYLQSGPVYVRRWTYLICICRTFDRTPTVSWISCVDDTSTSAAYVGGEKAFHLNVALFQPASSGRITAAPGESRWLSSAEILRVLGKNLKGNWLYPIMDESAPTVEAMKKAIL